MNNAMTIVEYGGVPVITTKQIAEAYGTESKNVSYNFRRNKDRFTEGKHYFLLVGQDLRAYREIHDLPINRNRLYLWTERGALLLAKSINTDTAWEAYERLVDFYFEKKNDKLAEVETFPEVPPRLPYRTSSTPVPKNPSWYQRNRRRMNKIVSKHQLPLSTLYHHILLRLGEEYDIDEANRIYEQELGYPPRYAIDIVSYFPELGRMADAYLDRIEQL